MRTIPLIGAALVAVVAMQAVIRAEERTRHPPGAHTHQPPHGGQVVNAGKYHFELVVHEGGIRLYVFDENMAPRSVEGITGNLQILVPAQAIRSAEFQPESDALEANVDLGRVRKFTVVVTLTIDGRRETARFSVDFRAHHRD